MQFVDRMSRNRKLDRLIENWIEYRDTVSRLGGQAGATPEQERQFLELKASIAASLPFIAESNGSGSLNTEAQANVRGMTDLMNSQLSLASHLPGDDFLNRWHTHYLYLNRFKGMAQSARPMHRAGGGAAPASMPGDNYYKGDFGRRYIRPIFNNWLTRFVVRLAVVAGLIILVAKVLNVDLNRAPEWGKQVASDWWGPGSGNSTSSSTNTTGGRAPAGPLNAPKDTRASVNKSTRTHQDAMDSAIEGAERADGSGGGAGPVAAVKPGQGKPVSGNRTVTINSGPRNTKYSPDGSNVFQPPATPGVVNDAKVVANRLVPRPVKDFFQPVTSRYGVEVTVAMVGIGLLLVAYMIFGRAR
ncbi:MAG TPA: hypothetical protein VF720_06665 [Candidatus Eisenbacteria bacterium]